VVRRLPPGHAGLSGRLPSQGHRDAAFSRLGAQHDGGGLDAGGEAGDAHGPGGQVAGGPPLQSLGIHVGLLRLTINPKSRPSTFGKT
jgi:hypothetical protein